MPTPDNHVRTQVLQRLQSLHRAGVLSFPRPPVSETVEENAPLETANGDNSDALRALNEEVCQCTLCPELVRNRSRTVFGVGNPRPRLCFFGEGPGADEDRLGEPFVGAAGKLLNKIISAMGLRREDVYILNVVKCRPPGNRTPTETEVDNCRPFFARQLAILQPEFICCLGACAAQTLLQSNLPVGRLRQQFHSYENASVMVTYHPAYLLRRPEEKTKTWSDMKMLMREMGIVVKSKD
jgi:DNA polymerase